MILMIIIIVFLKCQGHNFRVAGGGWVSRKRPGQTSFEPAFALSHIEHSKHPSMYLESAHAKFCDQK